MCGGDGLSAHAAMEILRELTIVLSHPLGDLKEDARVARNHDDKWQQEEAAEGEHVVGCLLPVGVEAAPRRALGEPLREGDGHVVEEEHLK